MKSLKDYTKEPLGKLLEETGGFFAFSQQQFDNAKVEGMTYVSAGGGLFLREGMVDTWVTGYRKLVKEAIQQDINDNGIEAIIERELVNYECYYVGEVEDAVEALKDYKITVEQVKEVYHKTKIKH